MSTKNPFGQLSVKRDEEDEDHTTNVHTSQQVTSAPLFSNTANDQKKKKKVRPEDKPKQEESYVNANEDEGFQVVKKKNFAQRPRTTLNENANVDEKVKKDRVNHGAQAYNRTDKPSTIGKRTHDRQSGTGRGKEIAKGGAGGHHTWGTNPKTTAREYQKHEGDVYDNRD